LSEKRRVGIGQVSEYLFEKEALSRKDIQKQPSEKGTLVPRREGEPIGRSLSSHDGEGWQEVLEPMYPGSFPQDDTDLKEIVFTPRR